MVRVIEAAEQEGIVVYVQGGVRVVDLARWGALTMRQ
jgi:hypothetical protein